MHALLISENADIIIINMGRFWRYYISRSCTLGHPAVGNVYLTSSRLIYSISHNFKKIIRQLTVGVRSAYTNPELRTRLENKSQLSQQTLEETDGGGGFSDERVGNFNDMLYNVFKNLAFKS